MKLDYTRPFLEVIHELASTIQPYPQRLVDAFEQIPRADFLPEEYREAFGNRIHNDEGYAGLLSQPSVIFCMLAALSLKGREKVFEGGTGTGYQTALLAQLSDHVYSVEIDQARMEAARARLAHLGISNVTLIHGDAAIGLPQYAPFDRMIFGAAIHGEVDQLLIKQMAARCRLVIPTGEYDPEKKRIVGDLLQCDQKNGTITQKINPVFHGSLFFAPLVTPRSIGWSQVDDAYLPSMPISRKRWRFPWL